ncbi:hypothetical protein KM043_004389 [Ampulex compressa]|nr:hypothetical protein KM043_004389 [Ampulex compressa]
MANEAKYARKCRVAIVGMGGVGKSLAHLLKMYPYGPTELRLCNRSDPTAIVKELSHIPTKVDIKGFKGPDELPKGLSDADIVVVTAGAARKEDTPRERLFGDNAAICRDIINVCADMCPRALIAIVSNPVDSLIPFAADVLRKRCAYRPEKLFGVCQIDQMRAQRFYAERIRAGPRRVYVPVVGGHSENTTVPLFSKGRPRTCLSADEISDLVALVREGGKSIVRAKKGLGGATYAMATAALHFVHKLCGAIRDEPHVILSAYVESTVTSCRFFSNELLLGPDGVHKNLGYGNVTDLEREMIDEAAEHLRKHIELGEQFVSASAE